MFPLLYIGITCFAGTFSVTHFVTREILKHKFESHLFHKKNKSKVKFKKKIEVEYVASRQNLSSRTLNNLWYSKKDYENFKTNYLKSRKYRSI